MAVSRASFARRSHGRCYSITDALRLLQQHQRHRERVVDPTRRCVGGATTTRSCDTVGISCGWTLGRPRRHRHVTGGCDRHLLGGMHAWLWPSTSACRARLRRVQHFGGTRARPWGARVGRCSCCLMPPRPISVGRSMPTSSLPSGRSSSGLGEHFDAPHSLACIAPRPTILNNAADRDVPARASSWLRASRERWSHTMQHTMQPAPRAASNLGLIFDESVASQPLSDKEWAAGHTVTPAMHAACDMLLRHCVLDGQTGLPAHEELCTLPSLSVSGSYEYCGQEVIRGAV